MHLSVLSPRGQGGGGDPRRVDIVKNASVNFPFLGPPSSIKGQARRSK